MTVKRSSLGLAPGASAGAAGGERRLNLRDLDAPGLAAAVAPFGVSAEVAGRLFSAVHRDGVGWAPGSLIEAQPRVRGLTRAAAAAIDAVAVWPELKVLERQRAADGFLKYSFKLADGPVIEAVRIPLPDAATARELRAARAAGRQDGGLVALPTAKYTVCVSSQAGCALACDFCATGRLGGIRSLETWEIVAQVRAVAAEAEHPVRGVVFMGMGEPLLNYERVMRAARILSHPAGPAIAAKAISISTAGVVPAIRRYTAERQPYRLVFSLGAPTSEARLPLMPIEGRWSLDELVPAIRDYAEATRKRVTIAYVAIAGVNTRPEDARRLAERLAGIKVKVNLIDVVDDSGRYRAPDRSEIDAFRDALDRALGAPVVRRYSGGKDIGAACGTLAGREPGRAPEGDAPPRSLV